MNIKYVTSLSSFLWTYQSIKVNAEASGNVWASAFSNPSNKRIKGLRTVKISVNQVPPTLFTPSVKLISKKSFSYPYLIPRYHPHYQGKFQLYKWQESGTRPSIKYLGAKYQVPCTKPSIRYHCIRYVVATQLAVLLWQLVSPNVDNRDITYKGRHQYRVSTDALFCQLDSR